MRVSCLRSSAAAAGAAALVAGTALTSASAATAAEGMAGHPGGGIRHVLLLSVDGLHQQDLSWYVRHHPASTLASLVRRGVEYANARTPIPSDSFPGLVGQVTGGDPGVTGIYYDDTFNHDVFPAGTTNCAGPVARRRGRLHRGRSTSTSSRSTPGRDSAGCRAASCR